MLINVKDICAKHHRVYSRYINPRATEVLDESLCNKLKDKVCIAESLILKSLKYELNFEMPYNFLDDLCKKYFRESDFVEIRHISRLIQLDIFRSGASLFFSHHNLAVAAFMFTVKLHHNLLTPLHSKLPRLTHSNGATNGDSTPAKTGITDPHTNGTNGHNNGLKAREEETPAPQEMQTEALPPNPEEPAANNQITPEVLQQPEAPKDTIQNELPEKEPASSKPPEQKNLTIPEIFPLGLQIKGKTVVHPPEEPTPCLPLEDEELMGRWFRELENDHIHPDKIFGSLSLSRNHVDVPRYF